MKQIPTILSVFVVTALAVTPLAAQTTDTGAAPFGEDRVGGAQNQQGGSSGMETGQTAASGPEGPAATEAGASPASDQAQLLNGLARDVTVARQIGHLATDKNMEIAFARLGDQVALTNSAINQQLTEIARAQNMQLNQRMTDQDQRRFEDLRKVNQQRFAEGFTAFVQDTYPRIIGALERLGDDPNFAQMAQAHLPALRDQLQASQQLAQGDLSPESAELLDRGLQPQRKDDPAVIPSRPNSDSPAADPYSTGR